MSDAQRIYAKAYTDMQTRERHKGRVVEISFPEACQLFSQPCSYCGFFGQKTLTKQVTAGSRRYKYISTAYFSGIDRIDSSLGYVHGNVVSCCKVCNRSKNDLPLDVWKDWARRLVDNLSTVGAVHG